MSESQFFSPKSLTDALELLEQYGEKAVIVNGGTDIVEKIACGIVNPEVVIYIQDISELKSIREENGYICIGGAATYQEVMASTLCQQFSGLLQAISEIGSLPIRIVGTPAGNIGTAVPAADCNVALIALNADIILASKNQERVINAKEMFIGYCRTQLQSGELIKEIRLPILSTNTASAFVKLAKRKAQDISQVAVGVCLTMESEVCRDISIALGAISSTAIKAYSLEKIMLGKKVEQGIAELKGVVPSEANLRSPLNRPYKEAVISVLVQRAINKAYAEVVEGRKI